MISGIRNLINMENRLNRCVENEMGMHGYRTTAMPPVQFAICECAYMYVMCKCGCVMVVKTTPSRLKKEISQGSMG
jgi:hypothetical protein